MSQKKIAVVNEVHSVAVRMQGWMMKDLGYEVYVAGGSYSPLCPNYHYSGRVDKTIFSGLIEVDQTPPDAIFLDTHPDTEKRFRARGLKNPIMLVWQMPVGPEWVRANFKPGPGVGSLGWSTSVGREIAGMNVCPNDHFWPAYYVLDGLTPRAAPGEWLITVIENAAGWSNVPVLEKLRDHPRARLELFGGAPPAWSRKIPQAELLAKLRGSLAMYHVKPFDTPGLAVMEAAVQGVPIIFCPDWLRTTQASDLFENEKSCLIVDTDAEKVVAAAERLRDRDLNVAIGTEGARRMREAMDWGKNKPRLLRLVEEIEASAAGITVNLSPEAAKAVRPAPPGPLHQVLQEARAIADQVCSTPDDRPDWLRKEVDEPEPNTFYYRFLWNWVKAKKPAMCLETGTLHGHSALHMAEGNPSGTTVITIDHNPSAIEEVNAFKKENIRAIRGETLEVFERIFKTDPPQIDLLFLDSSMRYPHTIEEFKRYSTLVRSGGLIIMDDININNDMRQAWAEIPQPKIEINSLHYMGLGITVKA
jgi:Methyltransferase domain